MADNKLIFVSYRRDDTPDAAGRLADALGNHFGEQNVFQDVESIKPGVDFVEALERALEACAVMLVVIGKDWTSKFVEHQRTGQEDYTRLEVATALKRNDVLVIPVRVRGASLPLANELPDDLRPLARRNAFELHNTTWKRDVRALIDELQNVVGIGEEETNSSQRLEELGTRRNVAHGTLRVKRDQSDEQRTIRLLVDGEVVGDLVPSEATELELGTGPHHIEVQARPSLNPAYLLAKFALKGAFTGEWQSGHITVHIESGKGIDVVCGFRAAGTVTALYIEAVTVP